MIAWARKASRTQLFIYGSISLFFVLIGVGWLVFQVQYQQQRSTECTQLSTTTSPSHKTCVDLEVVRSGEDIRRGLSGRTELPVDEGMLFDFGEVGARCMWMKDMHIPLDMIWLDDSGKVVNIETQVTPDTYPDNFCSQAPARYVIEVNAGLVEAAEISVGQQIEL